MRVHWDRVAVLLACAAFWALAVLSWTRLQGALP
jgi:hypothetical protein